MTEQKHTPGPFESWQSNDGSGDLIVIANDGTVARVPESPSKSRTEQIANARLIAAAPELLEALRGLADFLEQYPHQYSVDISGYLESAQSAIAKATEQKGKVGA